MLDIILGIYAFTVILTLLLLVWVLVIELRENKVKRSTTITEFLYCVVMAFIPIVNIYIIKNTIKEL